jgi:hypothetical protein
VIQRSDQDSRDVEGTPPARDSSSTHGGGAYREAPRHRSSRTGHGSRLGSGTSACAPAPVPVPVCASHAGLLRWSGRVSRLASVGIVARAHASRPRRPRGGVRLVWRRVRVGVRAARRPSEAGPSSTTGDTIACCTAPSRPGTPSRAARLLSQVRADTTATQDGTRHMMRRRRCIRSRGEHRDRCR